MGRGRGRADGSEEGRLPHCCLSPHCPDLVSKLTCISRQDLRLLFFPRNGFPWKPGMLVKPGYEVAPVSAAK